MPCNLAVTITKAAVSDKILRKLLTPEVVEQVVRNVLQGEGETSPAVYRAGSVVTATSGAVRLTIHDAKVNASYSRSPAAAQQAEKLTSAITAALSTMADTLLALQVREVLRMLGGAVTTQSVVVDNEGQHQQAHVFSLEI